MDKRMTRQDVWMVVDGKRVRRFQATVVPQDGMPEEGVLLDGRPVRRAAGEAGGADGWEYKPI